jgi:hypothetical protein
MENKMAKLDALTDAQMKTNSLAKKLFCGAFGFIGLCLIFCGILMLWIISPQPNPRYGKEFNPEREKMGIPVIPEDWKFFSVSTNEIIWENPIWDNSIRYYRGDIEPLRIHYQKAVIIQNETTIEETDIYMGDALRIGTDGVEAYERMLITCVYRLDSVRNVSCAADVYTRDTTFTNGNIEKAKPILEEWGLSYP